MNEKKILNANQMTGELLLGMVLYGIAFYIIYKLVYSIVINLMSNNENILLTGIIVIVLQALMLFLTFKLANRQAFKKGTICIEDASNVIKNISAVVIIILLIQVVSIFSNVDSAVNNVIEKNYELKYKEKILSILYNDNDMEKYMEKKKENIQKIKNQMYQYVAILEVGIIAVYMTGIFIERKIIYNKAEYNN